MWDRILQGQMKAESQGTEKKSWSIESNSISGNLKVEGAVRAWGGSDNLLVIGWKKQLLTYERGMVETTLKVKDCSMKQKDFSVTGAVKTDSMCSSLS